MSKLWLVDYKKKRAIALEEIREINFDEDGEQTYYMRRVPIRFPEEPFEEQPQYLTKGDWQLVDTTMLIRITHEWEFPDEIVEEQPTP